MSLEIKTIGVRGGSPKFEKKGCCTIFTEKDGNYIVVDSYEGQGTTYRKRNQNLIEIFEGGKLLFSGNFEELAEILKGE